MPKLLRVTDHALVRFLERVRGFKFDRERNEIAKTCAGVENGSVKAYGCIYEVKDGSVVTIVPETERPNRSKREQVLATEFKS
jgi:hypothetical protein